MSSDEVLGRIGWDVALVAGNWGAVGDDASCDESCACDGYLFGVAAANDYLESVAFRFHL